MQSDLVKATFSTTGISTSLARHTNQTSTWSRKRAAMRSRLRSAAAARLGRPSAMPSASVEETTRTYRRLEGFRGPAR
jgi:hypothetical protein